ncbi:ATP synthase gamma chain [Deltaproteobacteria bacterium]|nr:ATP synthase gamma chain [Deltaproteobacteria bacterium]
MTHALLVRREEVAKVGIVLVTSDRGLCGGFNVNLVNAALKTAKAQKAEGKEVVFYCVGKKGRDAIRKSAFPLERDYTGVLGNLNYIVADRIGLDVIDAFLRHDVDEVFLVYSEFLSLMRTNPTALRILPVQPEEAAKTAPGGADYLLEPSGAALLNTLLPRIVKALVYRGLLDTSTCENAARMAAMDNATRNCDDLIKSLTRLFNKTRQAVITNELIDIVGGVEALKG